MGASLTLSILEIFLLMFGAIILGITIHFFIASRRSLKATTEEMLQTSSARDEWKLRYFDDMDKRDKELAALKTQLLDAQEDVNIFSTEAEELRRTNKRLEQELKQQPVADPHQHEQLQRELSQLRSQLRTSEENNDLYSEELKNLRQELREISMRTSSDPGDAPNDHLGADLENAKQQVRLLQEENEKLQKANRRLENEIEVLQETAEGTPAPGEPDDYLEQLQVARQGLLEQNHKINQLLSNIDVIREKEEMQREMLRTNEELARQVDQMRMQLVEKEKEMHSALQQQSLANEMTSMLDSAYNEFNTLQDKISKLENQLNSSRMANIEFEDLREEHNKLARDYEQQKLRANALESQCKDLQDALRDREDELKDTNFQRQQLQKKVAYLEELNRDMQMVAEANKKLELQMRRVGELESRLNVVSAERDRLLQNTTD